MQQSEARNEIVSEIRYILEQMKKASKAQDKVYFYSAAYGVTHRMINHVKDSELILIDLVLNTSYQMINTRVVAISKGQETPVSVPANLFTRLEDNLGQLADAIEHGTKSYPILESIVNLSYSTTGNGFYLFTKGLLTV